MEYLWMLFITGILLAGIALLSINSISINKESQKFREIAKFTVADVHAACEEMAKIEENEILVDNGIRTKRAFEMYGEASFDTIWSFFNGSYWVAGYLCQSDTSIYEQDEGLFFDGIVCYKPMDDQSWESRHSAMSERGKSPIEAIEKAYSQWKEWKESISEEEFLEHYALSRASRNIHG